MNLSPNDKIAGLLAPLFALRTEDDLGVGDVAALRQFIDWSRALGFKLVQLLPINETGGDNSPYNAISSRAIDPTTLQLAPGIPRDLSAEAFAEVTAGIDLAALRRGPVKYEIVKPLKRKLLERAFAAFRDRTGGGAKAGDEFRGFCEGEKVWLADYTLFRVLMELNGERETWDQWQPEHAEVGVARRWLDSLGEEARDQMQERRDFHSYLQWIAHEQWREVKACAEKQGVALMGDIPFGVSYYSADVFTHPERFALDWSGGAPPEPYFKDDEFTQKWGQNWGIPLYRWDAMRNHHFDWWRQRVHGVRGIFHLFRIDHILGFYRIYAFPWRPQRNPEFLPLGWDEMRALTGGREPHFAPRDDRTLENCAANQRDGEEYLRVVLEESGPDRVVGEDLGTVPDYVRPSLRSLGIAGFKIPQWENYPDQRTIPGNGYERRSVATFATHDHKPLRALWHEAFEKETGSSDQAQHDLAKIAEFAGIQTPNASTDFAHDFYPAIFGALFRSESWIALVMITDLLGRKDRFNVPGTATNSNWTRRLHTTVSKLGQGRKLRRQLELVREILQNAGRT
ncbi:MAG TPA: 4-alpha-glucanotransferase [Chthoniobacterales bacterium]|jgi:4-alpha-glucanotransferase|nr:4-alpha-glucanotransferase [Chthoniobacterales bacterium]